MLSKSKNCPLNKCQKQCWKLPHFHTLFRYVLTRQYYGSYKHILIAFMKVHLVGPVGLAMHFKKTCQRQIWHIFEEKSRPCLYVDDTDLFLNSEKMIGSRKKVPGWACQVWYCTHVRPSIFKTTPIQVLAQF